MQKSIPAQILQPIHHYYQYSKLVEFALNLTFVKRFYKHFLRDTIFCCKKLTQWLHSTEEDGGSERVDDLVKRLQDFCGNFFFSLEYQWESRQFYAVNKTKSLHNTWEDGGSERVDDLAERLQAPEEPGNGSKLISARLSGGQLFFGADMFFRVRSEIARLSSARLSSEFGNKNWVWRTFIWKPRPASGPDCLMCVAFARQLSDWRHPNSLERLEVTLWDGGK